jgi:hypothetical protein
MKRGLWVLAMLLAIGPTHGAHAARVISRGYVQRVDPASGTITLRKSTGQQTILVVPEAKLTIDGRKGLLNDIMYNARAEILAWRDPFHALRADEVKILQPRDPTWPASSGPGMLVQGEVVGLISELGTLIIKTPVGNRNVAIGTAPVLLNGRPATLLDLAVGDRVQVQHTIPPGGLAPIPSLVSAAAPQPAPPSREPFRALLSQQEKMEPEDDQ